jgi:hypothetical protein
MLRLADLQKKIDDAAEEMCHLTQDDQDQSEREMCPWAISKYFGD